MTTDLKTKGSQKHEKDFAEWMDGVLVPGSGSQPFNKGDGRAKDHFAQFAFAWDCKSTQRQSITVTLAMLEKVILESHGERPMLPLRYYSNARLDIAQDWVAILGADFFEMREALAELATLKALHEGSIRLGIPDHMTDEQVEEFAQQLEEVLKTGGPLQVWKPREAEDLPSSFTAVEGQLEEALAAAQRRENLALDKALKHKETADSLRRQLDEAQAEQRRLAAEVSQLRADQLEASQREQLRQENEERTQIVLAEPAVPLGPGPDIPHLPWTVISQAKLPGGNVRNTGIQYDVLGHTHELDVTSIRTEPVSATAERLIVNDEVVRAGDLYISGKLRLRVGA